ncbi:unnamed protein product, partial [Prorocentrum cordatum]
VVSAQQVTLLDDGTDLEAQQVMSAFRQVAAACVDDVGKQVRTPSCKCLTSVALRGSWQEVVDITDGLVKGVDISKCRAPIAKHSAELLSGYLRIKYYGTNRNAST